MAVFVDGAGRGGGTVWRGGRRNPAAGASCGVDEPWCGVSGAVFRRARMARDCAGTVYAQSVKAGETVPQGSAIVLTVSKGTEMATVPDVGTLTADEATKQLENLGFKVKTVSVYNNGNYTPNTVKKSGGTAPAAGESVAKGETVIIQVYGEVETTTEPSTQATTAQ